MLLRAVRSLRCHQVPASATASHSLLGSSLTQLSTLTQDLPLELIQQALAATGTATVRRPRLPAEQVVWLVVGMVMLRHLNIVQVVDQLGLALAKPNSRLPVAPSSIHKARERVGPLPLAWLFDATAQSWAHTSASAHNFRGLAVYVVDGTTLRVPDSAANRAHFGGTKTSVQSGALGDGERGQAGRRRIGVTQLQPHADDAAAAVANDAAALSWGDRQAERQLGGTDAATALTGPSERTELSPGG